MKMIKIIRGPNAPVDIMRWYPGAIIDFFEEDGPPHFEVFEVPDPNHKSSLDYLEGV